MKIIENLKAYFNRLRFAWLISKEKDTAVIAVIMTRENIHAAYKSEDSNVRIKYMGLHPYIVKKSISMIAKGYDQTDLDLEKIKFDVEAEFNVN